MKYFDLFDNIHVPNRWHISGIRDNTGVEPRFLRGERLTLETPLTARVGMAGRAPPFSLSSFAVPLATTSLALAMAEIAGDDLQRFPVDIEGHHGIFALNAVRTIQCLDESKTEFVKWTTADHRADLAGQYRTVSRLKILPNLIPTSTHMFRIYGWTVVLVVSERLRDAMERAGCEGAVFREV